MKIYWTNESVQRLREIAAYIFHDNIIIAEKFIDKLIELAETLSNSLQKGRIVPEFSLAHIRELLYKNYRIVYIIKKNRIEILTVFEGNRLFKREEIKNIHNIN